MITDLIYKLGYHGWGEITLVTEKGSFNIRISYASEPLLSLFDVITEVWMGELEADAFFDGEGPIYYIRLKRESAAMVCVEFYENVFLDDPEYDFPDEVLPVPRYACSMLLKDLAFMIARQAENLLREFGLVRYRKRWMKPFPLKQYHAYLELIGYRVGRD